jgi:hypothetical protein
MTNYEFSIRRSVDPLINQCGCGPEMLGERWGSIREYAKNEPSIRVDPIQALQTPLA